MTITLPRPRILISAGVVLVLVVAGILWWALRPASAATADATSQTLTATASVSTFEQSVSTSGTLTPAVNESVSFAASGTVLSVDVAAGDTVTAGQQLGTIDTLQLTADRASAAYDLEVARTALEEAEDADDDSDSADALVTSRTASLALAQEAFDDADAAMANATLTAPVAGLVTSVNVAVGDAVSGSSSASSGGTGGTGGTAGATGGSSSTTTSSGAFTIVGTDAWSVSVSVGESDVANLAVGNQVEMTSDDLSETVFGIVTEIGKLPSSSSGSVTYPVTIEVTGTPTGLFDGVSVDVSIIYSRRTDVLTVPAAAVTQNTDGTATVELVTASDDDGNPTETTTTTVELGETSSSSVEIVSGLSEGDVVQYTIAIATETGDGESGTGEQGFPGSGDFGGGEMPDFSQLPGGGQGGQMPGGQG